MLLLYGMLEAAQPFAPPQPGVRGESVIASGSDPVCLYSVHQEVKTDDPEKLKADVLAFFSVISSALKQATIIPFRFPTLLLDDAALRAFLQEHGKEYAAELERLRGTVQMNITLPKLPAQKDRTSGTAYLQSLRANHSAVEEIIRYLQHAAPALEWKHSPAKSPEKPEMLHALIQRTESAEFRGIVLATMPQAHISGPWAPAAFVQCYPGLPAKPLQSSGTP